MIGYCRNPDGRAVDVDMQVIEFDNSRMKQRRNFKSMPSVYLLHDLGSRSGVKGQVFITLIQRLSCPTVYVENNVVTCIIFNYILIRLIYLIIKFLKKPDVSGTVRF